ncbi:MAG: biopolymer transporter ExbD [Bdellovibrionaceae bacterium]|nr:biopolymer transporter ExbD [Pseudobdellovibrionaceae bacterium]
MRKPTKHLDFELNLVPFIDLLSVCICFLLLTAVWLNIGTMNVKQAVGGQPAAETEKKPIIWVFMGEKGDLTLEAKDASRLPAGLRKLTIAAGSDGAVNAEQFDQVMAKMKESEPDLRTALIQPKAQTSYETIIDLMDRFKKAGLNDLGVVPL